MKERFAKLLLGEDMSGGGQGVCTALAISNAITNLSGLLFSQFTVPLMLPSEFISIVGNTQKLVSIIMCICLFLPVNWQLQYLGSFGNWSLWRHRRGPCGCERRNGFSV